MPQAATLDDKYGLEAASPATGVVDDQYGLEPAKPKQTAAQEQAPRVEKFIQDNSMKKNAGFTPGNIASNLWEGVKDTGRFAKGLISDISDEKKPLLFGNAEEGPGESTFHKYVIHPSEDEFKKAQTSKTGTESVGHSVAGAIPVIGPWVAGLSEQAGTGDVGGALARGAGQFESGKAVHGAVKSVIPEISHVPGEGFDVKAPPIVDTAGKVIDAAKDAGSAVKEGTARVLRNEKNEIRPTVKMAAGLAGAGLGYATGLHGIGELGGAALGPKIANALTPLRAPVPEFPGAPLPAAEDFYAHEGAERNAINRNTKVNDVAAQRRAKADAAATEAAKPVYPGAPLPAAEDFYSHEGAERNAMRKMQGGRIAEIGATPAEGQEAPAVPPADANAPVIKLPVPREPLPGENPGYMASIPRSRLLNLGRQGRPGAGEQIQNIGKNVLYLPEEYPGPRPNIDEPMGEGARAPQGIPEIGRVPAGKLSPGDTFIDETGDARKVQAIDGNKIRTKDGTERTYEDEIKLGKGELNSPESVGKIGAREKGVEGGAGSFSQPPQVKMAPSEWSKLSDARRMYEWRKSLRDQGVPAERLPTMEDPRLKPETAPPGLLVPPEASRASPLPTPPPSARWTVDRGAIPGEPMMLLDLPKDGNPEQAKAAIFEREDPKQPGYSRFEVLDGDGNSKGVFGTEKEAAEAAEKHFPKAGVETPKPAQLKPNESTSDKFYDKEKDQWSPERQKYHDQIAEQATAGKTPPQGRPPQVTITLGGTGAGKTTVTRTIMADDPNLVNIDSDANKLLVPEYDGLKKSDPQKAAARVHDESKAISKRIIQEAVKKGLDFVYDTSTGGGGDALFKKLKDLGYKVELVYADVPVEEAMKRARDRATNSKDPSNFGRFVPEDIVQKKHVDAAKAFHKYIDSPNVDEIRAFDTTTRTPEEFYTKSGGKEGQIKNQQVFDRVKEKANGPKPAGRSK